MPPKGGKMGKAAKGDGAKGKKKGTKKKAKAKLSEDAKNRQLEQRAAVEEERRRMREELINAFLRHKLHKEHCLTRLNQSKLIEKWRHALRDAKSQELSRELEMMKIDFDKRFAENNQEINRLMEALVQSGVDFVNMSDAHKAATKCTNEEHMSRLKVLEEFYQKERDSLQLAIANDYQKAMGIHFEEKSALIETIDNLQTHYCRSFTEQRSHFQIRKDEIINQGLEEEQTLRQTLERRLERKWQQLHESCVEGGELDEQRWSLYAQLRRKDRIAFDAQRTAEERLEQLAAAINKMQEPARRDERETRDLIELRDELHERRERWRVKLLKQQQLHAERLKAVAASSGETAECLEQLAKQGVLILRSAQRCHLLKPKSPSILKTSSAPAASGDHSEPFRNFWTRFNTAYLETVMLQRHQMAIVRGQKAESARRREQRSFPDRWVLSGKTLPVRQAKQP